MEKKTEKQYYDLIFILSMMFGIVGQMANCMFLEDILIFGGHLKWWENRRLCTTGRNDYFSAYYLPGVAFYPPVKQRRNRHFPPL